MREVLPREIVERRRKCNFSKLVYLGLARNLQALNDLVRSSRLEELGVIRRDALLNSLQSAALGVASGAQGMHKLNVTLALIKWLAMEQSCHAARPPRTFPTGAPFRQQRAGHVASATADPRTTNFLPR
jgi:hypothetical protein